MERKKRGILGFVKNDCDLDVTYVPMDKIAANPSQPRKYFKDEALEELSGSLKEYGVLQPILLRDDGKAYTIIAGERRYKAAKLAGLEKIPAIIKTMDSREVALIALVENVQREDLNFLEEARAYKRLMDDFGLTQIEIAEKMNKKQSTISNKIRLLSLPDEIQSSILENNLTERHARALLKLGDEEDRKQVIKRIIQNNLNVKQTDICNAIGAHHDEMEMTSLLAPIVQVCDAISGARPGARREIAEAYIKRLNDLEQLAMSYPGVTKTYAIQAGRELRVIVGADKISDKDTETLSADIAKKIQD